MSRRQDAQIYNPYTQSMVQYFNQYRDQILDTLVERIRADLSALPAIRDAVFAPQAPTRDENPEAYKVRDDMDGSGNRLMMTVEIFRDDHLVAVVPLHAQQAGNISWAEILPALMNQVGDEHVAKDLLMLMQAQKIRGEFTDAMTMGCGAQQIDPVRIPEINNAPATRDPILSAKKVQPHIQLKIRSDGSYQLTFRVVYKQAVQAVRVPASNGAPDEYHSDVSQMVADNMAFGGVIYEYSVFLRKENDQLVLIPTAEAAKGVIIAEHEVPVVSSLFQNSLMDDGYFSLAANQLVGRYNQLTWPSLIFDRLLRQVKVSFDIISVVGTISNTMTPINERASAVRKLVNILSMAEQYARVRARSITALLAGTAAFLTGGVFAVLGLAELPFLSAVASVSVPVFVVGMVALAVIGLGVIVVSYNGGFGGSLQGVPEKGGDHIPGACALKSQGACRSAVRTGEPNVGAGMSGNHFSSDNADDEHTAKP